MSGTGRSSTGGNPASAVASSFPETGVVWSGVITRTSPGNRRSGSLRLFISIKYGTLRPYLLAMIHRVSPAETICFAGGLSLSNSAYRACLVSGPTIPSLTRLAFFWNSSTACLVLSPKTLSTVEPYKPSCLRSACNCLTSSPVWPCRNGRLLPNNSAYSAWLPAAATPGVPDPGAAGTSAPRTSTARISNAGMDRHIGFSSFLRVFRVKTKPPATTCVPEGIMRV